MPVFAPLPFFRASPENFSANGFKILPTDRESVTGLNTLGVLLIFKRYFTENVWNFRNNLSKRHDITSGALLVYLLSSIFHSCHPNPSAKRAEALTATGGSTFPQRWEEYFIQGIQGVRPTGPGGPWVRNIFTCGRPFLIILCVNIGDSKLGGICKLGAIDADQWSSVSHWARSWGDRRCGKRWADYSWFSYSSKKKRFLPCEWRCLESRSTQVYAAHLDVGHGSCWSWFLIRVSLMFFFARWQLWRV